MAYPTIDAPYGLKPVNLIGGLPFAGATREMPIASNYGTAIFNGDVVQYKNDGTIIITTLQANTSPVAGVVGVFLGCSYTDPNTKQLTFNNSYPGSIVASDIKAFVCDDPNALYKVASVTSASADSTTGGLVVAGKSRAVAISNNAELVLNTGVVATGRSRMGIFVNNVSTILPITVVDVVEDTKDSSGNFTEFLVKITATYHRYNHTVGV